MRDLSHTLTLTFAQLAAGEKGIASGTSVTLVGGKGRLETEIELLGKRKRDIHRERERQRDTVISR